MNAQTIRSLQTQLQMQPPPPTPGTQAHATIHRSPSAVNSLELKLHLPVSAAASPDSEAMPIIIAYPVPGSPPAAVPMEVRDSAITLESVPPKDEGERPVIPNPEIIKEGEQEDGFDVIAVDDLVGFEVCRYRFISLYLLTLIHTSYRTASIESYVH